MKNSDFKKLTFWVDDDRSRLPFLTSTQRIEYFRRRANKTVLRPIKQILRQVQRDPKRSSAALCFGTCICSAIEAFGRFHTGKIGWGTGWPSFKAFVRDFMHADFKKQVHNETYAKLLHDHFRNGLAHGFTIKWGGFENTQTYIRIKQVGPTAMLLIDPSQFYQDFEHGVFDFVTNLRSAPNAPTRFTKFNAVFDELWIKGT